MTKGNIVWCTFVFEPISCRKMGLVSALSELRKAQNVFKFSDLFPQKKVFLGVCSTANLMVEWNLLASLLIFFLFARESTNFGQLSLGGV